MATATTPHRRRLGLALLMAALLLLAETASAIHELKHAIQTSDDLSCQLHLFADHFAKTPATAASLAPLLPLGKESPSSPRIAVVTASRTCLYRPRAPPLSS